MIYVALALWLFLVLMMIGPIRIGDDFYHPLYGKYPVIVSYEPGMTIYPRQAVRQAVRWSSRLDEIRRDEEGGK
jgi:hypothetical protein